MFDGDVILMCLGICFLGGIGMNVEGDVFYMDN